MGVGRWVRKAALGFFLSLRFIARVVVMEVVSFWFWSRFGGSLWSEWVFFLGVALFFF